jgi:crossover junction endodeoxyribonuclease RusA
MIGAFKAGRDGVADALGCDDHGFRPTYRFDEPVKGGAVVVEIGELF